MNSKDGKYLKIDKAVLTHDEPMKTLDIEYIKMTGKWRFTVCDMDRDFDKARGYEFYDRDWYMGYSRYIKEVTTDALSLIKLSVTVDNSFRYDVEMPVPETLRSDIAAYAEQDGKRKLPRDIIDRLEKAYDADEILDKIGKKSG